jgi:type I restriction enzyme, R subunit
VFAVTRRHAATLAQLLDDVFADRKFAPAIRYADFVVSAREVNGDDTASATAKIEGSRKRISPAFSCPSTY